MAETDTSPQGGNPTPPLAGMVVSPGDSSAPAAAPTPVAPTPEPAPNPPPPDTAEPTEPAAFDPAPTEQFAAPTNSQDSIQWTASEFVAHQKSAAWYGGLLAIALVLSVLVFLVSHDAISVTFIVLGTIVLGAAAARQPRQLEYQLSDEGIQIGQKQYPYEAFSSFSVVEEGAFSSIVFMPLKRFAPLTTIYYAPEDEDRIIELLMPRLPLEEYRHDAVDRLMRRVRF